MPPQLTTHHFGYLTRDVANAANHFRSSLGYTIASDPIVDSRQTATVQFLRLPGEVHFLELVSPTDETSRLANAAVKGVQLHHMAYLTSAITDTFADLREQGWFPVEEPVPAVAFGGQRIAWLMDRQRFLVELIEAGPHPLTTLAY